MYAIENIKQKFDKQWCIQSDLNTIECAIK